MKNLIGYVVAAVTVLFLHEAFGHVAAQPVERPRLNIWEIRREEFDGGRRVVYVYKFQNAYEVKCSSVLVIHGATSSLGEVPCD